MPSTITEMRTYMVEPGHAQAYVRAYAEPGRPTPIHHLGEPLGYFTSYVGGLNRIAHLWSDASLAERESKRALLEADPA